MYPICGLILAIPLFFLTTHIKGSFLDRVMHRKPKLWMAGYAMNLICMYVMCGYLIKETNFSILEDGAFQGGSKLEILLSMIPILSVCLLATSLIGMHVFLIKLVRKFISKPTVEYF